VTAARLRREAGVTFVELAASLLLLVIGLVIGHLAHSGCGVPALAAYPCGVFCALGGA
jgi:hypothetical protein